MKILVIEDDAESARYIAKGLRESGLVVDIASDGRPLAGRAIMSDTPTRAARISSAPVSRL